MLRGHMRTDVEIAKLFKMWRGQTTGTTVCKVPFRKLVDELEQAQKPALIPAVLGKNKILGKSPVHP